MYVMAPWAGRMRRGELHFAGSTHQVPCDLPPHAIHGTTYNSEWTIADVTPRSVVLQSALGATWPFEGLVRHEIAIVDDTLHLALELHASESMPAQLGWHPWFARPAILSHSFRSMYVRGADGLPTGQMIDPTPGPHDDCFVDPLHSPRITFDDGVSIELKSDCDHWVVYDEQPHGLCVEPQSGPPNGVNDSPHVVSAHSVFRKTFDLTCDGYPQIG